MPKMYVYYQVEWPKKDRVHIPPPPSIDFGCLVFELIFHLGPAVKNY